MLSINSGKFSAIISEYFLSHCLFSLLPPRSSCQTHVVPSNAFLSSLNILPCLPSLISQCQTIENFLCVFSFVGEYLFLTRERLTLERLELLPKLGFACFFPHNGLFFHSCFWGFLISLIMLNIFISQFLLNGFIISSSWEHPFPFCHIILFSIMMDYFLECF